jgi:hypothetical protein
LRRLGRAGLEALPLRARKFLSFSHTEKTQNCLAQSTSHTQYETPFKGHFRFFDFSNAPACLRTVRQNADTPVARWKGNVVSYTPVKSRRSQKQRLQHNSASRAPLSAHEWDARLFVAPRVIAQHRSVRRAMLMVDQLDKSGSRPTRHRASTHSSFSSCHAARQNHMENGPNFTDGKDFQMVGACCSLMVQTLPNTMNSMPIPPRHHPKRARDSFLPSRQLTHKRCSRHRVPASQ